MDRMIANLEARLDAAIESGNTAAAAALEDTLLEAYRAEAAEFEARERRESEAPRRAAEARLAYHVETDTLDLY